MQSFQTIFQEIDALTLIVSRPWQSQGLLRVGKSRFYRFCRTQFLSNSPQYLSCFPPIFNNILPIFIKSNQIKVQNSDLRNVVAISNCYNLRVFSLKVCIPKKSKLTKKIFFPTLGLLYKHRYH